MSRNYHPISIAILKFLATKDEPTSPAYRPVADKPVVFSELKSQISPKLSNKDFYNYLFRLASQELIEKTDNTAWITPEGKKLFQRLQPAKDGVWKLVIFDIPEKHKYVRTVLRAKLKQLHFKKWQNSIWVSPYEMDEEIEQELADLGKKFFVRLIKTTQINETKDLQKMFGEGD